MINEKYLTFVQRSLTQKNYLFSETYFVSDAYGRCVDTKSGMIESAQECKGTVSKLKKMDQKVKWDGVIELENMGKNHVEGCSVSSGHGNDLYRVTWNPHASDKRDEYQLSICVGHSTSI